MIHRLLDNSSIAAHYLREIRDINYQNDRLKFRNNLSRLARIAAIEISKNLNYEKVNIDTPLGSSTEQKISNQIVIASILRAGLPMHHGMLEIFDQADSAFLSAYREHHKDGTFEINLQYVTCPDLDNKTLIIVDPMLATGASLDKGLNALLEYGNPHEIHIVSIITSSPGLNYAHRLFPKAHFWIFAEDEELTAKSYIVPGLGDAGDLAFGSKEQD